MRPDFVKGAPIPEHMGQTVDLYAEVRELRLAMDKEVARVKERETELRNHMVANLEKSVESGGDTGASGLRYRVQIKTKTSARVTDWEKVYDYVAVNDRFDLLQKRVNEKAILELIEEGHTFEGGVERVHIPDVSITKV